MAKPDERPVLASGHPFVEYERARPAQVRDVIAATPIAYVPLGALEWHGEHAALGLDGIKAQYICKEAARRTGGVLFPPMQWGAFHTLRFPLTFRFPKRVMKTLVRRTLADLVRWGFRSIVLLTGHYPLAQIRLLRKECRRASKRYGVGALGISEPALALDMGYLGDHAAKWETSLLMAIDPSLVDLERLPGDTGSLRQRARRHGVFGACPQKEASAQLGQKALDTIIARLTEAASEMARTGGAGAAERIYRDYDLAFRNPIAAGKMALGTQSGLQVARFFLENVFRERHL